MSVMQLLVMDPARRPEIEDIRLAALAEDTPYFPYQADLSSHTGFLPVTIDELPTGFEYYFEPIGEGQLPTEASRHGSHQMITRTGGDMTEMLASLLFLRTAARLSGGAYMYPDEGIVVPPDEVAGFLSSHIEEVRKFLTNA
jgi:hypothetical protein